MQKIGKTSNASDSSIQSYKIITGPYADRISKLSSALTKIMQDGVQVTLIQ